MSYSLEANGYKVYFCDARMGNFVGSDECAGLVVAKSRSDARVRFCDYFDLEFVTRMSIKLQSDSADAYGKPGVVTRDPYSEAYGDYVDDLAHDWIDGNE